MYVADVQPLYAHRKCWLDLKVTCIDIHMLYMTHFYIVFTWNRDKIIYLHILSFTVFKGYYAIITNFTIYVQNVYDIIVYEYT